MGLEVMVIFVDSFLEKFLWEAPFFFQGPAWEEESNLLPWDMWWTWKWKF